MISKSELNQVREKYSRFQLYKITKYWGIFLLVLGSLKLIETILTYMRYSIDHLFVLSPDINMLMYFSKFFFNASLDIILFYVFISYLSMIFLKNKSIVISARTITITLILLFFYTVFVQGLFPYIVKSLFDNLNFKFNILIDEFGQIDWSGYFIVLRYLILVKLGICLIFTYILYNDTENKDITDKYLYLGIFYSSLWLFELLIYILIDIYSLNHINYLIFLNPLNYIGILMFIATGVYLIKISRNI